MKNDIPDWSGSHLAPVTLWLAGKAAKPSQALCWLARKRALADNNHHLDEMIKARLQMTGVLDELVQNRTRMVGVLCDMIKNRNDALDRTYV